jgi:hypothetical protein
LEKALGEKKLFMELALERILWQKNGFGKKQFLTEQILDLKAFP